MKTKRITSVVLMLALIFSLAACGTQKKAEDKTEKKQKTKKEVVWKDYKDVKSQYFNPDVSVSPKFDFIRYEDQIKAFEAQPVEEGKILFYGSSGFTRWSAKYGNTPLEDALLSESGEKVCLNHGFGGSTMHELCHFYERAVKPYKPKAIVITSFVNDFGAYTNDEMLKLMQWLLEKLRTDFPGIHIYITDFRPNAKDHTDNEINRMLQLNEKLLAYSKVYSDTKVIELSKEPYYYVSESDAGTYMNINKKMFIEDLMHYTPEGYKDFAESFKRALKEELK